MSPGSLENRGADAWPQVNPGCPERAARFAKGLGRSREPFVRLSLQELVDEAGLKLRVEVVKAA